MESRIGGGVEILPFTAQMLPQAAKLERLCFSEPWSMASLAAELENPLAVYFAAKQKERVVGYMGMHHILDEGHITNIAVSPDFRRRGVARLLVKTFTAYAVTNALRLLTLEVRQSNAAAIALYAGFGFLPVGVRKCYYRSPFEDAILMTLEFQSPCP